MAKIKVISDRPLIDGMTVTFRAPCDCTAVDGLSVSYLGVSEIFTFRDAHDNNLAGLGNLFSQNVLVKAVLDITNKSAYIQNADTNVYLEEKISNAGPFTKLWQNESPKAQFAAQTIQIDGLSEYTHIGVVTDWNCRAGALQLSGMQIFELSAMTGENLAALSMVLIGTEIEAGSRKMSYDGTTGIIFEAGKLIENVNNTAIIPYAIYGIKGVF